MANDDDNNNVEKENLKVEIKPNFLGIIFLTFLLLNLRRIILKFPISKKAAFIFQST